MFSALSNIDPACTNNPTKKGGQGRRKKASKQAKQNKRQDCFFFTLVCEVGLEDGKLGEAACQVLARAGAGAGGQHGRGSGQMLHRSSKRVQTHLLRLLDASRPLARLVHARTARRLHHQRTCNKKTKNKKKKKKKNTFQKKKQNKISREDLSSHCSLPCTKPDLFAPAL